MQLYEKGLDLFDDNPSTSVLIKFKASLDVYVFYGHNTYSLMLQGLLHRHLLKTTAGPMVDMLLSTLVTYTNLCVINIFVHHLTAAWFNFDWHDYGLDIRICSINWKMVLMFKTLTIQKSFHLPLEIELPWYEVFILLWSLRQLCIFYFFALLHFVCFFFLLCLLLH